MLRPGRDSAVALIWMAGICAAAAQQGPASEAADFPNRAVHIVVPFPAGGPPDIVARIIGERMSKDWGQPVVIDNRPGAHTVIGAQAVAKAAPNDYTILMPIDSTLTINHFLYRNPPYDPSTAF